MNNPSTEEIAKYIHDAVCSMFIKKGKKTQVSIDYIRTNICTYAEQLRERRLIYRYHSIAYDHKVVLIVQRHMNIKPETIYFQMDQTSYVLRNRGEIELAKFIEELTINDIRYTIRT
jgi:hypothetical protein